MRRIIFILTVAALCASCSEQFNAAYLLSGGAKVAQAATLSDSQIQAYVGQYVQKLDAENAVLPETSPYVKRVRRMTAGITSVNGIPLNFKVYKTNEVNAFACADGSVRIYSGLLEAMTDDEALGVVGHEIGHVALKHSKMQFKQALMTSALRDAVVSTGGAVAVLTASQLGDLGEVLMSASFSRKQSARLMTMGMTSSRVSARILGRWPWPLRNCRSCPAETPPPAHRRLPAHLSDSCSPRIRPRLTESQEWRRKPPRMGISDLPNKRLS